MENISQYRDNLDKTLMSSDLSNVESVKMLVENQMSKSTQSEDQEYREVLVQKRTKEVANLLSMLRSASGKATEGLKANEIPHGGWKIKQDNQDCRVMYREGPAGTPFHTLLVEGYVDGPVDVCLCLAWEAELYQKWWPHFNIPTFKVLSTECVKKIRMDEQISLVRMKLSWPISAREALVHYVTFDYQQDGLIVVLLNTISETENIDKSTHGFTRDGIPDVENITRMDVVGGVAMQKVSANRSYFRTIVNMDIKLDFIPPAIINFVSRQIIGSGFKLYKKEVAAVSKGDTDFTEALKKPFYGQIRDTLYSENDLPNGVLKQEDSDVFHEVLEQKDIEIVDADLEQETVMRGQLEEHLASECNDVKDQGTVSEIEEIEETRKSHENTNDSSGLLFDGKKEIIISPEVNKALGTLEKVISVFREIQFNPRSLSFSRFVNNVFADLEENKSNDSKHFVKEFTARNSQASRNSLSTHSSRLVDHEVVLTAREDGTSSSYGTQRSSFSFAMNDTMESTLAQNNGIEGEINNVEGNSLTQKKTKKHRFCCLGFTSGQLTA
ncbi:hypothetical protein CTI12_AA311740 [Artemisia annua]|uniref:START-like domain-containing protein n=1 Tax=Artemisia annua TaxID=35608 RepID=A0A2U1MQE7_ARTAN|nr:hypothetical protein CTI12_AA311740 [Artemisia annua]